MATYDQLTEWAGRGHVTRARRDVVAGWRIPDFMKIQLVEVGIPVAPRLIERVAIQSEADPVLFPSRRPLYRLTEQADPDEPTERSSFGVQPETGAVFFVVPHGEAWFANSSVDVWLDVLHRYGSCVTASELLSEPDGPEEYLSEEEEEQALAWLNRLAEELKEIDPLVLAGLRASAADRPTRPRCPAPHPPLMDPGTRPRNGLPGKSYPEDSFFPPS
ncbi:SUKH-4 family immunity protein [Streptomyces sp. NPDC051315]|uniref:SUKH-4 family immunity protein n=1 Tax=Streptomyces sp. NPDC051315 TaxID=3365650 RepID=UPI0037A3A649